jgi:hypothetical protein
MRNGGRTDSKPETKKAKKFHPNPKNEGHFNSRWQEQSLRPSLQQREALELTGEEHTVHHMEQQLQRGPAEGFMEGLGAGTLWLQSRLWLDLATIRFRFSRHYECHTDLF